MPIHTASHHRAVCLTSLLSAIATAGWLAPLVAAGPEGAAAIQQAAAPPASAGPCAAPPRAFGSAEKSAVSMEGKIYLLPEGTLALPDFSQLTSVGSIYTSAWDVAPRSFSDGFPGVTDRFEWFAIDYQGSIYVPVAGAYHFRLGSDDGAILSLDGKEVINNDHMHPYMEAQGDDQLAQGVHTFRLSYFQGPRYFVGLRLWVTPPGGVQKILELADFDKDVADARRLLGVTEDAKQIHVKFGSEILFDTGKYDLKPAADGALGELAQLIHSYAGYPVLIEGHTDNVGTKTLNQTLSENRAAAVKTWLVTQGHVPEGCLTTRGYGATRPIAPNSTAQGRQKNRRVEVSLTKPAGGSDDRP
jgi:outer membrane protein OmpA-like peptidoglycan-associated protein